MALERSNQIPSSGLPALKLRLGSVDYGHNGEVGRRNPATLVTRALKRCCSVIPSRFKPLRSPKIQSCDPFLLSRHTMEHIYHIDDDVLHQFQRLQGRNVVEASHVYTILALLPVEADGRPRYRIKSKDENFERVVAEDLLSRSN